MVDGVNINQIPVIVNGTKIKINGLLTLLLYNAHSIGTKRADTPKEPVTYHISTAFSKKIAKIMDIDAEAIIPIFV